MKNSNKIGSALISRRTLFSGGAVAGAALLLPATEANATVKLSKDSVKFQTVASNGHNCGSCKLFLAPSDCTFVQGPISSDCSCWIWRNKIG